MIKKISTVMFILTFAACVNLPPGEKNVDEVLDAINKKCPQMLDEETRLDGVEAKEPNTIVYNYTLINVLAQNVDTTKFYKAMWPGLLSYIRVSDDMKNLRNNSTTLEYYYKDKLKKEVYRFKIGPKDYN